MIVNRNTLAGTFQAVEQVNRFFVFQEVCLAASVSSNPVVGRGDAVPTKSNNQDVGLRVEKPLNLLENQLMCFADFARAAISANLKIRNDPGTRTVGGVSIAAPTEAARRIGDEPTRSEQCNDRQCCDELSFEYHWGVIKHNDPGSAIRRPARNDCNRDAHAGIAPVH